MTLWTELDRAMMAAGDDIILRQRGEIYEIRFNGIELMSNLTWRSEAVLAERSIRRHGDAEASVLIGGLGMGFTLRAALDLLGLEARVTVCELIPAIGAWNAGPLAHLAGNPLDDPRTDLRIMDVMDLLQVSPAAFDVILMDTDNGPDFTVRADNTRLYAQTGLAAVRRALRPGGIAAFWSAEISDPFEDRLDADGWDWSREDVQLPGGRVDAFHHIYLAKVPAVAARPATPHPLREPAFP
ncbi:MULTISPECIES: hypothetical protein [Paracoccaceae]|uniref:hypothetical protein n=1 Tax=Paracoccaceae TaxID=31989 RepID=UPI00157494E1|nr:MULTISPECIES: hypothetical protein [Paracoccaceae]MBJ2153120.1 hypothetical protein [Paracoccus sp. IB05]NTT88181.1 hypothetical protein [Tabrizicola sp. SY72]